VEKKIPSNEQHDTSRPPPPPIVSERTRPHDQEQSIRHDGGQNDERSNRDGESFWTWPRRVTDVLNVAATVVIAVATCAYVGVSYFQWWNLSQQLQQTKALFATENRPWIALAPQGGITRLPMPSNDKRIVWVANIQFSNVGHTPAVNVSNPVAELAFVPADRLEHFERNLKIMSPEPSSIIYMPNIPQTRTIYGKEWTQEQHDRITQVIDRVVMYASITYRDTIGPLLTQPYISETCMTFNVKGDLPWSPCRYFQPTLR
jgi:hypothetical protein